MTTARENLVNRVIKIYGYEGKETLEIASMCEVLENKPEIDRIIEEKVKEYENKPLDTEEEAEDAETIYAIGISREGTKYRKPRT